MKKILAILGFLLITPLALAQAPIVTKEDKEAFVQCMNNGECWPNDHIKGDFFKHLRVRDALNHMLNPDYSRDYDVRGVWQSAIQKRLYIEDRAGTEASGRLQQNINIWGYCPVNIDHQKPIEWFKDCDGVDIFNFAWVPSWEKGSRIRISMEGFYDAMVGADGRGGFIQILKYQKIDGRPSMRYWQEGMKQYIYLQEDLGLDHLSTKTCLSLVDTPEHSFKAQLTTCLGILREIWSSDWQPAAYTAWHGDNEDGGLTQEDWDLVNFGVCIARHQCVYGSKEGGDFLRLDRIDPFLKKILSPADYQAVQHSVELRSAVTGDKQRVTIQLGLCPAHTQKERDQPVGCPRSLIISFNWKPVALDLTDRDQLYDISPAILGANNKGGELQVMLVEKGSKNPLSYAQEGMAKLVSLSADPTLSELLQEKCQRTDDLKIIHHCMEELSKGFP